MSAGAVEGVLITGVYGSGKSTVAAEIADQLENTDAAYAAIDLDWLGWFDAGNTAGADWREMMFKNLGAVVGNYLSAGVRLFVLAYAVRDRSELQRLAATVPFSLRVVRLVASMEQIQQRLGPHLTTGRRQDVRNASEWIAGSIGEGIEDRTIVNDGPIEAVAGDIVAWLGWAD